MIAGLKRAVVPHSGHEAVVVAQRPWKALSSIET